MWVVPYGVSMLFSHALLVQLVMCHQSAQIYLDVGHYPERAGRLWQQNYLLAQNWFERDLLFALALIQNRSQSVPVSSSRSDRASELCSSLPSFCISHVRANTNTHLCLLKERERGRERERDY